MSKVPLGLSIYELPWTEMITATNKKGIGIAHALARYVKLKIKKEEIFYNPTVGDVLNLFNTFANQGRPIEIRTYGPRSYEITRKVFRRVGLDLPHYVVLAQDFLLVKDTGYDTGTSKLEDERLIIPILEEDVDMQLATEDFILPIYRHLGIKVSYEDSSIVLSISHKEKHNKIKRKTARKFLVAYSRILENQSKER